MITKGWLFNAIASIIDEPRGADAVGVEPDKALLEMGNMADFLEIYTFPSPDNV
jgi:hypothetical protein